MIKMKKKYKKAAGIHFMDHDLTKISSIRKEGFNFLPILTDSSNIQKRDKLFKINKK